MIHPYRRCQHGHSPRLVKHPIVGAAVAVPLMSVNAIAVSEHRRSSG
jgi:hypothetical protein